MPPPTHTDTHRIVANSIESRGCARLLNARCEVNTVSELK